MSISDYILEPIRKDEEFVLYRAQNPGRTDMPPFLLLKPVSARPTLESLKKLEREYSLKDELNSAWAVRPLSLFHDDGGQPTLKLEHPGGETLDRLIAGPMEMTQFLRIAAGLASAVSELHKHGLIHRTLSRLTFL